MQSSWSPQRDKKYQILLLQSKTFQTKQNKQKTSKAKIKQNKENACVKAQEMGLTHSVWLQDGVIRCYPWVPYRDDNADHTEKC